ncbi:MAG TPA: N-acetylornithine carbamoyltransferase [Chitinophagaceae bacterium]|nr:N-acetylornithine carbamoyltransferase [Chitinophagaceae bacterium]
MMKNFLSVDDVADIAHLMDKALAYKKAPYKDQALGQNKTLGMLFMNPSMRTRISTQIAAKNLGMEVVVFNVDKEGWRLEFADGVVMDGATAEHVKEAAAVMGQYFDLLAIRTFPGLKDREADYSESYIRQFVRYAGIPVVSLESGTLHPLQSLADLITIRERIADTRKGNKGGRVKVVMTWAPHIKALPQSVPNSFAEWMGRWGETDFVIAQPEGYELDEQFTRGATIEHDQDKALQDADFVYVKSWSSYKDYGSILSTDPSWMITAEKLQVTNDAKVMHCLPVRRNLVIADEVLDGPASIVTAEAGNRVWAAQAVLSELLRS